METDWKPWRRRWGSSRFLSRGVLKEAQGRVIPAVVLQLMLNESELLSMLSGNVPPSSNVLLKAGRSAPAKRS